MKVGFGSNLAVPSVPPVLIPGGELKRQPRHSAEGASPTGHRFEGGPLTNRPVERAFPEALLNVCLFNTAEHYVRGKTPEWRENVTAKELPHAAAVLLPSEHRREEAILCAADSPADFQSDPFYQSHRRADGQAFLQH